jgi:hypothetical protein
VTDAPQFVLSGHIIRYTDTWRADNGPKAWCNVSFGPHILRCHLLCTHSTKVPPYFSFIPKWKVKSWRQDKAWRPASKESWKTWQTNHCHKKSLFVRNKVYYPSHSVDLFTRKLNPTHIFEYCFSQRSNLILSLHSCTGFPRYYSVWCFPILLCTSTVRATRLAHLIFNHPKSKSICPHKVGEVYSLEYSGIPEVLFMPHRRSLLH